MVLEKYPAYGAVLVATLLGAAIGASMQGATTSSAKVPPDVFVPTSSVREPGAVNLDASKSVDALALKAVMLKTSFASLSLQVPAGLKPARCMTQGEHEEQHANCAFAPENGNARMATVSMPADKDTFIPWSWHQEVVEIVRAMPPGDSAILLGTQFEQATGARLTDATLLPTEPDALAFGIVGHVAKIKFPGGFLTNSFCAMSFAMASNRPTKITFCSAEKDSTIEAIKVMTSSFQVNNKSLEIDPDSAIQKEHEVLLSKIRNAPDLSKDKLIAEEETYQRESKAKCYESPQLSRRRYQCLEMRAKERLTLLEPPAVDSTNSEQPAAPQIESPVVGR